MTEVFVKSVGVVVFEGNKVLLVGHNEKASHFSDEFGLPAVKVKDGETEVQAAVRGLKEEASLETIPESLKPIDKKFYALIQTKKGPVNYEFQVFLCLKYAGKPQRTEKTIPQFIEIENLGKIKLLPNIMEAVQICKLLNEKQSATN